MVSWVDYYCLWDYLEDAASRTRFKARRNSAADVFMRLQSQNIVEVELRVSVDLIIAKGVSVGTALVDDRLQAGFQPLPLICDSVMNVGM